MYTDNEEHLFRFFFLWEFKPCWLWISKMTRGPRGRSSKFPQKGTRDQHLAVLCVSCSHHYYRSVTKLKKQKTVKSKHKAPCFVITCHYTHYHKLNEITVKRSTNKQSVQNDVIFLFYITLRSHMQKSNIQHINDSSVRK